MFLLVRLAAGFSAVMCLFVSVAFADSTTISFDAKSSGAIGFLSFNTRTKKVSIKEGKSRKQTIPKMKFANGLERIDGNVTIPVRMEFVYVGNRPMIVYRDPSKGSLRVAYRGKKKKWIAKTIDDSKKISKVFAAVECGNLLCISYYDSESLRFARGKPGAWKSIVVEQTQSKAGAMSAISSNTSGRVAMAYFDPEKRALRLAIESIDGSWIRTDVPDYKQELGMRPAIAFGDDEAVHIVSSRYKPDNVPIDLGVFYSRRDAAGGWSQGSVAPMFAGSNLSIALTPENRPIVAYRYFRLDPVPLESVEIVSLQPSGMWEKLRLPEDLHDISSIELLSGKAQTLAFAGLKTSKSSVSGKSVTRLTRFVLPSLDIVREDEFQMSSLK